MSDVRSRKLQKVAARRSKAEITVFWRTMISLFSTLREYVYYVSTYFLHTIILYIIKIQFCCFISEQINSTLPLWLLRILVTVIVSFLTLFTVRARKLPPEAHA